jgi:circadian clock protein KaiC
MTRRMPVSPESDRKAMTGIAGFDEISRGGLPRGRTTLVIGTPGAGKTVFALQSLVTGAREYGEAGIFVAFEESSRQILDNAGTFGWDLPELESRQVFFLDAHLSPEVLQSGGFDIAGMLATLSHKVRSMNARRVVFDGIDVLLTLLDDPVAERREMYRLREWLLEHDLTGIITAKSGFRDPLTVERWGFMQFIADAVVLLHHRVMDRVSLRGVRILKYRGSPFAANEHPLVIGPHGVDVATFGPDELDYPVSSDHVSTGIVRLDEMLSGGYFRGSGILVTGAPGTAKTTLAGAFAAANCDAGERVLYASFDEPANQIVRNLRSVGTDLAPHVAAGLLRIYSVRTEVRSAEEHMVVLQKLIREYDPSALVIDPISALTKSGGPLSAVNTAIRLLDLAKSRGMTALCTSLVGGRGTVEEATDLQVSTLADTWIHLSYVQRGGERNRALSIVKSRGMAHSNQVRELILGADGATLTDVYVEGGDVLMGTARYEKEMAAQRQEERVRQEAARRRAELDHQRAALQSEIDALRRQLDAQTAEIESIDREQEDWRTQRSETRNEIRRRRAGPASRFTPVASGGTQDIP